MRFINTKNNDNAGTVPRTTVRSCPSKYLLHSQPVLFNQHIRCHVISVVDMPSTVLEIAQPSYREGNQLHGTAAFILCRYGFGNVLIPVNIQPKRFCRESNFDYRFGSH
jgi:hypothetical protein